MTSHNAPWCPPIVELSGGIVGHLLAWEMHERDGSWHAWVSWVHETGGRHVHKVVDVRAGSLQPLEHPDAYSAVPRRVRGNDGLIRPWSGESGLPRSGLSRSGLSRSGESGLPAVAAASQRCRRPDRRPGVAVAVPGPGPMPAAASERTATAQA
ncbi:MAG TPA: hypothetical protein VHY31_03795 [Streptosporangiaceae bacterium]|nr:hypothetical protein [Streptosporangiaceae bacterium]